NMFLINSGQAWDAARKYVLFGMLKDKQGEVVGTNSPQYDTLGIGEQIGGPLEDLTGPALNNFIKFVAVVGFVTSDLYDEFPDNTWILGIGQVFLNFGLVSFFKFGLAEAVRRFEAFLRRRREAIEYEEGVAMLREIERHEKRLAQKLEGAKKEDAELQLV
ncbi:hppA, partial [Symbiodinium pilosum]